MPSREEIATALRCAITANFYLPSVRFQYEEMAAQVENMRCENWLRIDENTPKDREDQPTHWMPLPLAPGDEATDGNPKT